MKRVAVVLVMIAGLLGVGIGSSAQNPTCGIEGLEFGAQYNPCLFLQEWNVGMSSIYTSDPVFWFGLAVASIEYQGFYGPYFKVGIPGFNLLWAQYLTNQWDQWRCFASCSYAEYWELKLKIPLCLPIDLPSSGTFCFFYTGLGAFCLDTDSYFDQQEGLLLGATILYIVPGGSSGAWIECSYAGLEMGFSIGSW